MANLEREAINLAHIWQKTYSSLEDGEGMICCYWFIGLKLDMEGGKRGQWSNLVGARRSEPVTVLCNIG